jgi:crotonobetainyl-CoA:carnitine CoA-transferase CaiB-like acyl-CoA transferase
MITNAFQKKAYDEVAAALPFQIDPAKITVEHGLAYSKSRIRLHDYAVGVMAAYGSVVEHIGTLRGLSAQTMKLNRRLSGLMLNSLQLHFLNGSCTLMDTWPVGPDNGTYRAKDGRYVTMIGLHPHLRDKLLDYLNCPNSAKAIQVAVEKKTAQQIEDEAAAVLNLPVAMMRSPEEWLAHPQGAETAKRPLVDIKQQSDTRKRELGKAKHRPLEGVRVVELTHLVAGPMCARLLAEQGAEVIKIQPPLGDWITPLWLDASWGKKNISLDIKSRFGKGRLIELLTDADVLVSSQRPDALARLGLDDKTLREINPNLIYSQVSGYVHDSPWGARRCIEQIAQTAAGMVELHSRDLPEPSVVSVLMNDYLTGYLTATGAIAALAERETRGGSWSVNTALTRTAATATSLVESVDVEPYAPVTMQDLIDFAWDQESPSGVFTRLGSPVEFSHTPSMAMIPSNWPGTTPDTVQWTEVAPSDQPPIALHYPSKLAREGGIRNLVSCNGIVDRGDGRGGFSLLSKELMEYVVAHRNK